MNRPASAVPLWSGAWPVLVICLSLLEVLLRRFLAAESWAEMVLPIMGNLAGYLVIWWLSARFSLLALSLCYLGLPYFFFAVGWLRWPLALLLSLVLAWALLRVYAGAIACCSQPAISSPRNKNWPSMLGFVLVIAWLHMSGSGGNGYQTVDYVAHNGRLQELIDFSWPVRYGEGRALVFYVGYYLPAAALGKLAGLTVAYAFLYLWTLAGVWLACLWLATLAHCRLVPIAALLLVFFGAWDVVGYLLQDARPWTDAIRDVMSVAHYRMDLWAGERLQVNVGAYLSDTFQLFWAPHQIVAGWILAALLFLLASHRQYRLIGVVYALHALWAPMLLLAMAPLVLMLCLAEGARSLRAALSIENLLVGGVVCAIFGSYYLGGTALEHGAGWLWNLVDLHKELPVVMLMFLLGWGIHALWIWPFLGSLDERYWIRFLPLLLLTLFLLPWYRYGEWGDLMSRGSAPLMFLLLLCLLRVMTHFLDNRRYGLLVISVLFILPGSISALRHIDQSVLYYRASAPFGMRSVDSPTAAEYIGPDDSFFFRYLARQ